mmetsp:Transcript_9795/g.27635  ORF Transcript_9795/g.27635 Transcript_9795/m.27635 type:complete len:496 (-) Transcript_9795:88-1575(-)
MASIVAALADLWTTLNVEVVIFCVTLASAFLLRGMPSRLDPVKPSKACKVGKATHDSGNPSGGRPPSSQRPRCAQPTSPCGDRLAGPDLQGNRWDSQAAAVPRRKHPAQIIDEVVDGMREQPGTRFASRALQVYTELREQLRREGLQLPEAVRGARHGPLDFYAALVQCVVRVGQCHMIEDIMDDMVHQGVNRPLVFYESTMKQLAGQKHYHLALAVYDRLSADGLEPSAVTCSCLISFAAEIGELQRAVGFFEKLSSLTTPSIRAYMTVLRVYGRRQDWTSSLATFRDMQRRGVHVDSLVLNVILATGVSAAQIGGVEALLTEADSYDPPITDVVSYNTLAKCYVQQSDFDGAREVVLRMRRRGLRPNAITFNSVMDAAVRSHRTAEAWEVLKDMRTAGLRPDKYTCSILVKGLVHQPLPGHIQNALDLLHEVDSALDKTLRTTLFHAVIEAAAQTDDSPILMHVFAQARQHHVVPTAAACRKLKELAEVPGTG